MNEQIIDMRDPSYNIIQNEITMNLKKCYMINRIEPFTIDIYNEVNKLFNGNFSISNYISTPMSIDLPSKMKLGNNIFINSEFICQAQGGVEIGNDVNIGPRVTIISVDHDIKNKNILHCKSIVIKNNVWIGAGVIITAGVTIGENAVVAAGAVVTKDVAPNTVVAGVPAKVIKVIE